MHKIRAIARRELSSYFNSPMAYIVIVSFLLVSGFLYFLALFGQRRADMRFFFAPQVLSPSMLLVILAPAVAMRLVAEERKSKTLELLTTMPITDTEVIVGKFLGAMGLVGAALATTLVYAVTVSFLGPLDWGPVIAGYLGLFLFAGALVAIGLLASTLTDNQIVAFIMGFFVSAALYFVYWLRMYLPVGGAFFEFVSVSFHLDNLARGVIDSRDVLYYLTLIGGALFLSIRALGRQHA
jgi:ABC-2 type transport system permease protein